MDEDLKPFGVGYKGIGYKETIEAWKKNAVNADSERFLIVMIILGF